MKIPVTYVIAELEKITTAQKREPIRCIPNAPIENSAAITLCGWVDVSYRERERRLARHMPRLSRDRRVLQGAPVTVSEISGWVFWIAWTTAVALCTLILVLQLFVALSGRYPHPFHVDGRA